MYFFDDGSTIPAYNNLIISGILTPKDLNGNYIQISPIATGANRIWRCGDYVCGFDKNEMRWIIFTYDSIYKNALFYSSSGVFTTKEGTKDNPKLWNSN